MKQYQMFPAQKNEKVEFVIHYPIEPVKEAYRETTEVLRQVYEDGKTVYQAEIDRLNNEVSRLTNHNSKLNEQVLGFITKISDKI